MRKPWDCPTGCGRSAMDATPLLGMKLGRSITLMGYVCPCGYHWDDHEGARAGFAWMTEHENVSGTAEVSAGYGPQESSTKSNTSR